MGKKRITQSLFARSSTNIYQIVFKPNFSILKTTNKPEREIATVQKLMMIRKSEIDYRAHFESLGIKRPAAVYLTKILESGESDKIQRFKKLWQEMVEEKLTNQSAPKEQNEQNFEGQFVYIKVI